MGSHLAFSRSLWKQIEKKWWKKAKASKIGMEYLDKSRQDNERKKKTDVKVASKYFSIIQI